LWSLAAAVAAETALLGVVRVAAARVVFEQLQCFLLHRAHRSRLPLVVVVLGPLRVQAQAALTRCFLLLHLLAAAVVVVTLLFKRQL
jgi:hypothetical protein